MNKTQMRAVCEVALHYMETPGDFSQEEVCELMDDLASAAYNRCPSCGTNNYATTD